MSTEIQQHGYINGKEYQYIQIEEGIVPISDSNTGAKSSEGYKIKYLDSKKNTVAIGFSKTYPQDLSNLENIFRVPTSRLLHPNVARPTDIIAHIPVGSELDKFLKEHPDGELRINTDSISGKKTFRVTIVNAAARAAGLVGITEHVFDIDTGNKIGGFHTKTASFQVGKKKTEAKSKTVVRSRVSKSVER